MTSHETAPASTTPVFSDSFDRAATSSAVLIPVSTISLTNESSPSSSSAAVTPSSSKLCHFCSQKIKRRTVEYRAVECQSKDCGRIYCSRPPCIEKLSTQYNIHNEQDFVEWQQWCESGVDGAKFVCAHCTDRATCPGHYCLTRRRKRETHHLLPSQAQETPLHDNTLVPVFVTENLPALEPAGSDDKGPNNEQPPKRAKLDAPSTSASVPVSDVPLPIAAAPLPESDAPIDLNEQTDGETDTETSSTESENNDDGGGMSVELVECVCCHRSFNTTTRNAANFLCERCSHRRRLSRENTRRYRERQKEKMAAMTAALAAHSAINTSDIPSHNWRSVSQSAPTSPQWSGDGEASDQPADRRKRRAEEARRYRAKKRMTALAVVAIAQPAVSTDVTDINTSITSNPSPTTMLSAQLPPPVAAVPVTRQSVTAPVTPSHVSTASTVSYVLPAPSLPPTATILATDSQMKSESDTVPALVIEGDDDSADPFIHTTDSFDDPDHARKFKHRVAERRRREKIQEAMEQLKSLLSLDANAEQSTVMVESVEMIVRLQSENSLLKSANHTPIDSPKESLTSGTATAHKLAKNAHLLLAANEERFKELQQQIMALKVTNAALQSRVETMEEQPGAAASVLAIVSARMAAALHGVGVSMVRLTLDGRIVEVNDVFESITLYHSAELVNRRLCDVPLEAVVAPTHTSRDHGAMGLASLPVLSTAEYRALDFGELKSVLSALPAGEALRWLCRMRTKNGDTVEAVQSFVMVRTRSGQPDCILALVGAIIARLSPTE